ncbi:hypothetical protein CROQUDRAFT_716034 [Cronartium quercuum f. sp. fusiforme G11]|uniref:Uncharacterized protein n=1 Tax=Cronartium quercuum f. sp. fusiforme G11 TaxID=708437 RepID=A0A9P6NEW7_9BASI|nr:hypothetical protein CROQUDRAFT_716034 [Cronartium quercuum f. sp. fusiforme G11]
MWSRNLVLLFLSYVVFNQALFIRHHRLGTKTNHLSLVDGNRVHKLVKRRISDTNSNPKVLSDLHNLAGCSGEICGTLAGDAVAPLLAGASECAQQDMADRIIDSAKSQIKDSKVRAQMIQLAITYRKTERNTFPDYNHQPPTDRNSLYCQKSPKNFELNGIIQVQSPEADPNLFFDPKSTNGGGNVKKGTDLRASGN